MCAEHPVLGTVSLSELLATWATHDLTHLHQITRVIAHQYREAVGPFSNAGPLTTQTGWDSAALSTHSRGGAVELGPKLDGENLHHRRGHHRRNRCSA